VSLPEAVPARNYRGDLLEPLALLARALREKGETVPPQWVEDAADGLRAGRLQGLISPATGEVGGVLLTAFQGERGFSHLYLTEKGRPGHEGLSLIRALLANPPKGVRRIDFTISAATAEIERELGRGLSSKDLPFTTLERVRMFRSLDVADPPAMCPLPAGYIMCLAQDFPVETLARLDFDSFEVSPDKGLVVENLADDVRVLGKIIDGELGPSLKEASPAIVHTLEGNTEELVGFLLSIQQGIRTALIADVAVSPRARRLGLGRALLSRALRGLVARGFSEVGLWVTKNNVAACDLYKSAGFRVTHSEPIFIWNIVSSSRRA
jgi:ribosomal protein S18 acetylase RimI-like enzyme